MEEKIPCIKCDSRLWEYIKPYLEEWGYIIEDISSFNTSPLLSINRYGLLGQCTNFSMKCKNYHDRELVTNVEEFLERAAKLKGFTYKRKIMEEKEVKIQVPEGYEIDKENSTFECIKFKKKDLTLAEIFNESVNPTYNIELACSTAAHMDKIDAINNLIFVAKYLNDGWVPDFKDINVCKHSLCVDRNDKIYIESHRITSIGIVYFKSEELALQAIEILGEKTIKQALSNNY